MLTVSTIRKSASALAGAESGNWAGCSAALKALTIPTTFGLVGGKASLSALIAAGEDPNAVLSAMRSVPVASELLDTLTATGVDWADPLTDLVMGGLVQANLISQNAATAVRSLSSRLVSVAQQEGLTDAECSAAECQRVWQSAELSAAKLQRISQLNATQAAVASLVQASETALSASEIRQILIEQFDLIAGA